MRTMTYAEALVDGLWHAMKADPRVSLVGSYVLGLGPLRHHMDRIRRDFPDRVVDPPTAEAAIAGLGAGAAMAGARPLVDLTTASFIALAWSQIVGEAAVARLMSGGQVTAPVVFHALHGLRGGGAAQHSGSPQGMLWNAPGLEIVLPSTPRDAKGLLRRALQTENPTVFLDHAKLMAIEEPVPEDDYAIDFGVADVKRAGRDVTIVATSLMVQVALDAARRLAAAGIEAEVVDPRTLVPFDQAAILASVARTGRLVVVDEAPLRAGVAAEIAATVAEHGFRHLKAPPRRVARADAPTPFSPPLEAALAPDADKVIAAVRATLA
jgi:pyruvate dehydrogenase E1 component beta subunit